MMKNDGFIYPKLAEKDFILGGERSAPFEVINESGDWTSVLPLDEVQRNDKGETNGCTNFGTTSQVEILLDYLYKFKENFSERFQAVLSEQQQNGNDPQKVYESIRNSGMLTEELLPFLDGMTFSEYLSPKPMTQEFIIEAKKFLEEYEFKHEYIYPPFSGLKTEQKRELLMQALKRSPVGVSVSAWAEENGIYIKPEGVMNNHWCVLVGGTEAYALIYDSYPPHIKRTTWDHFDVAKGIWIKKREKKVVGFIEVLKNLIKALYELFNRASS